MKPKKKKIKQIKMWGVTLWGDLLTSYGFVSRCRANSLRQDYIKLGYHPRDVKVVPITITYEVS